MGKLEQRCKIWDTPAALRPTTGDYYDFVSPRAGGAGRITGSAEAIVKSWDAREKARISTWIIDEHHAGNPLPAVTAEVLSALKMQKSLDPLQRANRLLDLMATKLSPSLGAQVTVATQSACGGAYPEEHDQGVARDWMLAYSESISNDELAYLLGHLAKKGWIERPAGAAGYLVTIGGFEEVAEQRSVAARSEQAFVAMWFDHSMEEAYIEGIKLAVEDAGYKARRIDAMEHNNKIDDEILAELRRSRFVVADFTHGPEDGHRGGVYYEAGFAHGLGLPVIFTCHKGCIGRVHFDTRQYNHIVWENPAELRQQLSRRISATIGDGPLRLPAT